MMFKRKSFGKRILLLQQQLSDDANLLLTSLCMEMTVDHSLLLDETELVMLLNFVE